MTTSALFAWLARKAIYIINDGVLVLCRVDLFCAAFCLTARDPFVNHLTQEDFSSAEDV